MAWKGLGTATAPVSAIAVAHVAAAAAIREIVPAHAVARVEHVLARSAEEAVEKFTQTLKEQVLWIERFATHEQLRAFARTYNREWLLERHGYLTPLEERERLLCHVAVA
jgi:hypothetical protein